MLLRRVRASDYERARELTETWWDARPRAPRLPRVFFVQFASVSFVLEIDGDIAGLILGHLSQTRPGEASPHFVAVDPRLRRLGLGRRMYESFFAAAEAHGRTAVRALVMPSDRQAIAFHRAVGFEAQPGDAVIDGVPVWLDYAGRGGHRVVLRRPIGPGTGGVYGSSGCPAWSSPGSIRTRSRQPQRGHATIPECAR